MSAVRQIPIDQHLTVEFRTVDVALHYLGVTHEQNPLRSLGRGLTGSAIHDSFGYAGQGMALGFPGAWRPAGHGP